jgi:hypothetical protein
MMRKYTMYEIKTGRVIQTGFSVDANLYLKKSAETDVILDVHADSTQYVSDSRLCNRPSMVEDLGFSLDKVSIHADGIDVATMSNIPTSSMVVYSGPDSARRELVQDGTLEFVTDIPGEHVIRIECFPYLPEEVTIHAT